MDLLTICDEQVARVRRWHGARSSGGPPPSVAAKTSRQGKNQNRDGDEQRTSRFERVLPRIISWFCVIWSWFVEGQVNQGVSPGWLDD